MNNDINNVRVDFIERMGLISQDDGWPRIAGRLLGLMIFDGHPYSFSDLAIELQVSRGSISTNARMLEHLGLIERTSKPGERQDYFQLTDAPYSNILQNAHARAKKSRQSVVKTSDALPKRGHTELKGRLLELEKFYETVAESLDAALQS